MSPEGTLRIEPGAAERMEKAFDRHAENLRAVVFKLRNYTYTTGFAGFPSATEHDAGFRRKRDQAIDHLNQQIEETKNAADAIRAAGVAYNESGAGASITIRSAADGMSDR